MAAKSDQLFEDDCRPVHDHVPREVPNLFIVLVGSRRVKLYELDLQDHFDLCTILPLPVNDLLQPRGCLLKEGFHSRLDEWVAPQGDHRLLQALRGFVTST